MVEEQPNVAVDNKNEKTNTVPAELGEDQPGNPGGSDVITAEQPTTSEGTSKVQERPKDNQGNGKGVDDDEIEGDYVIVVEDQDYWYETRRAEFFTQMETYLAGQIDMCDHYRRYFEQQSNLTMANRFAGYSVSSGKHLEIVKTCWRKNDLLPKFEFEQVTFSCLPVNIDVKDKELQLVVKTKGLPVTENVTVYCVGEFDFPYTREESYLESLSRWRNSVAIEPQKLVCCSGGQQKQVDKIHATDTKCFIDPKSDLVGYDRPLKFFVDKGKSRTLKRKFKLIKLTFYEKAGLLRCDKKIGSVQVKIDTINDEHSVYSRAKMIINRKSTPATVETTVKVREPLTNKLPRAHKEKILVLK